MDSVKNKDKPHRSLLGPQVGTDENGFLIIKDKRLSFFEVNTNISILVSIMEPPSDDKVGDFC